jgi:large subunit ribosomal protein L25
MSVVQAKKRDQNIKAKKLRKAGITPASIYGKNLKEPIHLQITQREVTQLLRTKTKGSKLTIDVDGQKYIVLLKEITYDTLENKIEYISFQSLVADEMVASTANIVLVNKDKVPYFIQQLLSEIPYKAYPSDLVDMIYIDLDGFQPGDSVKVEDLEIAKNKNIEILIEPDSMILNVVDKSIPSQTSEETEDNETASDSQEG